MKRFYFVFLTCISLYGCTVRYNNSEVRKDQSYSEETECDSIDFDAIDYDATYEPQLEELDPIVDSFYSLSTDDKIIFYSNYKGQFFSAEGGCHEFEWIRRGNIVTITYPELGSDRLIFDEEKHSLSLKTKLYGTIVFQ